MKYALLNSKSPRALSKELRKSNINQNLKDILNRNAERLSKRGSYKDMVLNLSSVPYDSAIRGSHHNLKKDKSTSRNIV